MPRSWNLTVVTLLVLAAVAGGCGGGGDDQPASTGATTETTAPAARFEKVVDTAATVREADATRVGADELRAQTDAIEQGLERAGFSPNNVGTVGGAKADIVIDTSWAVYVYESDRAAAEFAVAMQDIYRDPARYEMFRVDNRIYLTTMTSPLSDADTAKLHRIAAAAEGAIGAR